jgi:hypothetical protein
MNPGPELDAWVLDRIAEAERYLKSLPEWKRRWLEFKWLRVDPIVCRVRCWWTGQECPWE